MNDEKEYTVKLVEKYEEMEKMNASMCLESLVIGATLISCLFLTASNSMNSGITLSLMLNLSSLSIMAWQCSKFFINLIKKAGLEKEFSELMCCAYSPSLEYLDDWMDELIDRSINSGMCKVKKL